MGSEERRGRRSFEYKYFKKILYQCFGKNKNLSNTQGQNMREPGRFLVWFVLYFIVFPLVFLPSAFRFSRELAQKEKNTSLYF